MSLTAKIDRRALFTSGAAAALLVASGVSAGAVPQRGGRLRMALSGADRSDRFDPRNLIAHEASAPMGLFMQVSMAGIVFDTLIEIAADGTLRGELAEAWRSNADATIWDVDLRRDVQFHNGADFSAEDVVASFQNLQDASLGEVIATNARCARFVLDAPDRQFPFLLAQPHLVILPGKDIAGAIDNGIGTGLYKLHKFESGRQLVAHRVEQHFKDGLSGWFDSIELVGLSSDVVRAEALRDHYVDVADLTHLADLADVENITAVPKDGFMNCAVDHCVALPAQIGAQWPLDNLRAAERWWMA